MIPTTHRPSSQSNAAGLLSVVIVVAALYLAREIFVLIAMAIFLAFLLQPLARRFERLRLGRTASALAAVLIALVTAAALSELVAGQLGELGNKLPEYEKKIHEKLQMIKSGDGGVIGHAARSIQDFRKDLISTNSTSITNAAEGTAAKQPEVKPVPVEVRDPETSPLQFVRALVGPVLNGVATLFVVTILCIFILIARDDLRARLIRIVGSRNVKLTNQVLNETGQRVSSYLLMQLIVNASYGVPIGLGLWLIGIPNPLLWGMISALFRYIPYAGPWIAASMPLAVGFAISSGWSKPLLILGLFMTIELLTANLVEPWLYGNSTGITPLAVLLSAVFWTWMWGPIGLLLSMPLTICLVSIGRYVPQLELLDQLFGENESKR